MLKKLFGSRNERLIRVVWHRQFNLDRMPIRESGDAVQLLLWRGDRIHDTLTLLLQFDGLEALSHGLFVEVKHATAAEVIASLEQIANGRLIDPLQIAAKVETKFRQKWDSLLPDDVLDADFSAATLDLTGTVTAIRSCLAERIAPA